MKQVCAGWGLWAGMWWTVCEDCERGLVVGVVFMGLGKDAGGREMFCLFPDLTAILYLHIYHIVDQLVVSLEP
ncbi:hypothetical protein SS1G_04448 [Sclerotinia sclerotiorum 1980 UF-70]|uniref:Uncharacterized protein n=1 Tax=Sclerotinia sclerotiorum (strain ATCC 18683 / 1980 / Ss-1) TaxID=665079 RepID=A7EGK7_SCLS1|nr:hypothetical protein SS1G_04448 [Sclerotinia sclerotiorum 1980 UF-70]EDO01973.1 hypothetical protein SS1G_04448 [Sclerotinia sclerotiorum 1980 UF-70]